MKKLVLAVGVVLASGYALAQQSGQQKSGEERESAQQQSAEEQSARQSGSQQSAQQQSGQQSAQQLYQSKCAACHGKDGKGTTVGKKMGATDLAATSATEAQLETVITNGKNKMPAYKGKLTEQQIKELATYIKNGMK